VPIVEFALVDGLSNVMIAICGSTARAAIPDRTKFLTGFLVTETGLNVLAVVRWSNSSRVVMGFAVSNGRAA
jgi:hypothetical protein